MKSLREYALVKVYDRCVIPVGLHYYGITENLKKRKQYKTTSLQHYIDEYGWNNINTTIVADGLTRKEAEQLEDKLIKEGWERGDCINIVGSGGWSKDNEKRIEYKKKYYQEHKEERKQYTKQWKLEHVEHRKEYEKTYWKEHKDEKTIKYKEWKKNNPNYDKEWRNKNSENLKVYRKQWRSKPENKIAYRVRDFNRRHSDKVIETPLEAKNKYLEYGYIPSYIKNDDLV